MLNFARCASPECSTVPSHLILPLANIFSAHKRSIFPYFDEFGNSENRSSFACLGLNDSLRFR